MANVCLSSAFEWGLKNWQHLKKVSGHFQTSISMAQRDPHANASLQSFIQKKN